MASFPTTPMDPEWPPVDEHLVEPGTPYEMYEGELVYVPPAREPHGFMHSQLSALVEAHAAPDFRVASDLLTRVAKDSEIAPDVSVIPRAPDPRTGGRQLEHLAFEVASSESLSHVARKARMLTTRGVRRVFAINVERARVLEWSVPLDTWRMLDAAGQIEDPALGAPLPISAMIRDAASDDAVARALLRKHNAVLEEALAERAAQAAARSRAEALLVILHARGLMLGAAVRARIFDEQELAQLDRWLARAATCTSLAELFFDR
jgi:Putative restriction endonuclease